MPNRSRKWLRRPGRPILLLAILIGLLLTFGLSADDEAAYRTFNNAVDRWQINPEFRDVALQYSKYGSDAMRTHILHMSAERVIMALRSIPGLPKEYAVNDTSRKHYDDFAHGPLSAYLHLCSEQDVKDMAGMFAEAGRKTGRTESDLRNVLKGYKMDFPVVIDDGALRSVADLLRDTDAARGFSIQEDIGPRLMTPIRELAADLHFPTDPDQMSADQQRAVFDRLDSYVHVQDEELWRTKQLNDFCNGVWAQVYGPPYKTATVPILMAHDVGEISLIVLLLIVSCSGLRRKTTTEPIVETNKLLH
jgi:hypothetical protein